VQFTEAQVFGKAALPALRELGCRSRELGSKYCLTPRLLAAINFLQDHLKEAKPRRVSACDQSRNIVVFSDGAFENGVATWGFFLVDTSDNSRFVAGGQVPQHLVQFWISTVGEQIITQVELLAILAARKFLGARCLGRKLL